MSLDVGQELQRTVEALATRAGLSVDAWLRRRLLEYSVAQHATATTVEDAEAAAMESEQAHSEAAA